MNDTVIKWLQLQFATASISLEIEDTKEIINAIHFVANIPYSQ